MSEPTTTFENKASILADLWLNYRQDDDFIDFIEYNDLGLPLAYALAEGIVEQSPKAVQFVNETFDLFLVAVGVEDVGEFETLDDVFAAGI